MSDKDYFVMLIHPNCGYTPLMENEDDIAKFQTNEDAVSAAINTSLGEVYGYEVFAWVAGCNQ